jgi:hypothetical protein
VLLIVGILGGLFLVGMLVVVAIFIVTISFASQTSNQIASAPVPAFAPAPAFNPVPIEPQEPSDVNVALAWLAQGGGRAERAAAWLDKQTPNPAFRRQVVAAIDRHHESATVNVFARETFLNALATWSGPEDVPVLVRSLDTTMNAKVLDALVKYKNDAAARGVVRKLGGLTFFPASATLKRMGSTAEDAVADFLLTANGTPMHEGARLLEIIGTRKSVEKMRQAMQRDHALDYQGKQTIAAIQNR